MDGVNRMFGRGMDIIRSSVSMPATPADAPALPPARQPQSTPGAGNGVSSAGSAMPASSHASLSSQGRPPVRKSSSKELAASGRVSGASRSAGIASRSSATPSTAGSAVSKGGKRVADVRSMPREELEETALRIQTKLRTASERLKKTKSELSSAKAHRDAFAHAVETATGASSAAEVLDERGQLNHVALARLLKRQRNAHISESASVKASLEGQLTALGAQITRMQAQVREERSRADDSDSEVKRLSAQLAESNRATALPPATEAQPIATGTGSAEMEHLVVSLRAELAALQESSSADIQAAAAAAAKDSEQQLAETQEALIAAREATRLALTGSERLCSELRDAERATHEAEARALAAEDEAGALRAGFQAPTPPPSATLAQPNESATQRAPEAQDEDDEDDIVRPLAVSGASEEDVEAHKFIESQAALAEAEALSLVQDAKAAGSTIAEQSEIITRLRTRVSELERSLGRADQIPRAVSGASEVSMVEVSLDTAAPSAASIGNKDDDTSSALAVAPAPTSSTGYDGHVQLHRRLRRAEEAEATMRHDLVELRDRLSADQASFSYAKNVIVQYLGLPAGARERGQLLPVLRQVLQLDDDDLAAVGGQARLSLAGGAASIFGANIGRGGHSKSGTMAARWPSAATRSTPPAPLQARPTSRPSQPQSNLAATQPSAAFGAGAVAVPPSTPPRISSAGPDVPSTGGGIFGFFSALVTPPAPAR